MSFTTISPTYNILVRRICRIKAFQGLITKEMQPNLDKFFNEDICGSSNPTNVLIYHNSLDNSHDVEESLTRVSVDQLEKIDNQIENIQQWMSQQYPESESLPFIEGLKRMVQSNKIGVDILCGIAHIVDSNIMPMKSCVEVLGYTQPPSQVNHSIPLTIPMASVPTFTSNIMTTST